MSLIGGILAGLIILVGVLLVLFVVFSLGRLLLGLLVNIILGFLSIVIINAIFNLGIPWDLLVIVITAILGLPGVAIIVILKLLGITV